MSEYEGKTHWRRKNQCSMAEVLYYESMGEMMPPEIRKELLRKESPPDEDAHEEKC